MLMLVLSHLEKSVGGNKDATVCVEVTPLSVCSNDSLEPENMHLLSSQLR